MELRQALKESRAHARKIVEGTVRVNLLTTNSAKMDKSSKFNYLSVVFHGQPAIKMGQILTCPDAGICTKTCIAATGRMRFDEAEFARLWRTWLYVDHWQWLAPHLIEEIRKVKRKADKQGLNFSARLNGTTDLPWECKHYEGKSILEHCSDVQFYDYTKTIERCFSNRLDNYRLVYSHNEKSIPQEEGKYLKSGGNISVIFEGKSLPRTLFVCGEEYPVVDGDAHDLRHLDPSGTIVGLRYKMAFSKRNGKSIKPDYRMVMAA